MFIFFEDKKFSNFTFCVLEIFEFEKSIKSNEKAGKSVDDLRRQKLGEKLETQEKT